MSDTLGETKFIAFVGPANHRRGTEDHCLTPNELRFLSAHWAIAPPPRRRKKRIGSLVEYVSTFLPAVTDGVRVSSSHWLETLISVANCSTIPEIVAGQETATSLP